MTAPPLYQRVLGARFDVLPDAVRGLHEVRDLRRWRGVCSVERGTGFMARLVAWISGLPPVTDGLREDFCYEVRPERDGEVWSRGFTGMAPFTTRQWCAASLLCERAGPMTLGFSLVADGEGLRLVLERCWVIGVSLPRVLHPRIAAMETARDGVFWFDVSARFPWGGLLVRYRGWLRPEA